MGADDPSPRGEGRVGEAEPGWGAKRTALGPNLPRSLRRRMTSQEVKLWMWLQKAIVPAGFHFRRQVPIDRYIVDFACLRARLIVEVDGGQHGSEDGLVRDAARDRRLADNGYGVLRLTNRDVDRGKVGVLDTIYAALVEQAERGLRPTPVRALRDSPSPRGEGSVSVSTPNEYRAGSRP